MNSSKPHRHLYYDHQVPTEPLQDPEHSAVTPSRFSAHSPTQEDEFFAKEERREREAAREETDELPIQAAAQVDDTHGKESAPRGWWSRVALQWRP